MLLPEATRRSLVTVITQTGGVVVVRLVWAVVLARVVVVARVGAVPAFWYLCRPCRSCETFAGTALVFCFLEGGGGGEIVSVCPLLEDVEVRLDLKLRRVETGYMAKV